MSSVALDHVGDRRGLRHVGRREAGPHAELGDDFGLGLGDVLGLAEAVEHDRGARRRERAGNAKPDTAGRAGDKRHPALQGARALFDAKRYLNVHGPILSAARLTQHAVVAANVHGAGIGGKCRFAKVTIAGGFGAGIGRGYGAHRQSVFQKRRLSRFFVT